MSTENNRILPEGYIQLVLDSTVEGIWTIGLDGLITYINRAAVKMFGFQSADQMIGRNSHELVHHKHADGSHYPQLTCPIYKAFQLGVSAHLEDEVLWRSDGTCFYADYRSVPLVQEGKILGAVVTFVDNTAKRRSQEELNQNRAFQAATLKSIGDAVITTDCHPSPRITFLNPVAEKLTGWGRAEAIGRPVSEVFQIIHQSTRKAAANPVVKALETGTIMTLSDHIALVSKDGVEYIIEDSAAPIKDASGKIDGIVLVFRDVTEQARTRDLIETTAMDFKNLAEAIPQIVWTATPSGVLNYTNLRWLEYSGSQEPTEWGSFVHPGDLERVGAIWARSIETGQNYDTEFRLFRKSDSKYRWHLVRAIPVRDSSGAITKWLGTNTDIHDQKLAVQQLEKERDIRERFVSALSHDLRSPLSAAKMSAQLILRDPVALSAVEKHALRVVSTIDRADGMIQDLLDASLIRSGDKIPLKIKSVDLKEVLGIVIDDLTSVHGNRFVVQCPENLSCHLDPRNIQRVIENLCNNAIKYGDPVKPVNVTVTESKGKVQIAVQNSGRVLADNERGVLF